ncbi:MAG: MBL fold metallo-hydrolase [Bryobacteraceae bacterium]|jgi:beta-lactamase superfamily II metal-dependent hydrolase
MKKILFSAFLAVLLSSVLPAASKTFDMYLIDTEGGKSLLLISPLGESMLIDTGFPGSDDRDAKRIAEAVKAANLKQVDHLVTSHYDGDHVANVTATAARVPIKMFYDHGEAAVKDPGTTKSVQAYLAIAEKAKRVVVKPGDKIPFKGIDVLVVTAAGKHITTPVKGGGAPNPYCKDTQPMKWTRTDEDNSENGNAVGLLFTYGKFRMLDLADLTWNREMELMCPNNPIGSVDLFMVSHHGNDISNSPALVDALHWRVALMNNGARKIGAPSVLKLLRSAPGMQALYLSHYSVNGAEANPPEEFIANIVQDWKSPEDGKWLKVSVDKDADITVTNGRTNVSKTYKR